MVTKIGTFIEIPIFKQHAAECHGLCRTFGLKNRSRLFTESGHFAITISGMESKAIDILVLHDRC